MVRAILVAWALAACDVGGSLVADESGPVIVSSIPEEGATGVDRAVDFRVFFDRPLLPSTVHRGTVRVESGAIDELVSTRFDPVDESIVIVAYGARPLDANVTYRIVVDAVRDHEGRSMGASLAIRFETGSDAGAAPVPPAIDFAAVQPILTARCALGGCHAPPAAALGLDLSSAGAIEATAIDVVSRELPRGTTGVEGGRGALAFAAMPILDRVGDRGSPATSYLLYKIVGTDGIFGERMPPIAGGHAPLDDAETRLVSDWILSGAPTR
jgi:hypothetical protein